MNHFHTFNFSLYGWRRYAKITWKREMTRTELCGLSPWQSSSEWNGLCRGQAPSPLCGSQGGGRAGGSRDRGDMAGTKTRVMSPEPVAEYQWLGQGRCHSDHAATWATDEETQLDLIRLEEEISHKRLDKTPTLYHWQEMEGEGGRGEQVGRPGLDMPPVTSSRPVD